ncbi:MAG: cation diffusion facilitator family transporter [Lachnospirales bacterium]
MNNLLVKVFLKFNYKKENKRDFLGVIASIVGICSNILLFLIKFFVGVAINSISVISDSFNNLSDTLASGISIYAINSAKKPPDKEHPFGHGRSEYIASLILSFIILIVGWEFFKTSLSKIFNPEKVGYNNFSIILLSITVAIKLWQYTFNSFVGKYISSKVITLTAKDSLNDAFITFVTIISILFTKYTGIIIDGYLGVVLSFFLIYQGYNLIKDTISPLLGEATDKEFATEIRNFIEKNDNVIGTHDLIVHNYGTHSNLCTVHVEVSQEMDLYLAHNIIDEIEKELLIEFGILATIHLDPVDVNNEDLNNVIQIVKDLITKEKVPFSSHDFRMIQSAERFNIVFELEIPYNFDEKVARMFTKKCGEAITFYNESYSCIINLEHSFIL